MKKYLIFAILLYIFSLTSAHAASEVLLKSTADTKYQQLIKCVKATNNDISLCVDKFSGYLKAEKKLLSSAKDKGKYQARLVKMIDFLKKSTDIFIAKARKTQDLKVWKQAATCSALLSKLSDKYASYKAIEQEYRQQKKGASASKGLAALLRKIQQIKDPDAQYLGMLESFITTTQKGYNTLPPKFQQDATAYAQLQVNRYIEQLREYNAALQQNTRYSFQKANTWQTVYSVVSQLSGVDTKQGTVQELSNSCCSQHTEYEKRVGTIEKSVQDGYVLVKKNKIDALSTHVSALNARYTFVKSVLTQTSDVEQICSNPPQLAASRSIKIENSLREFQNLVRFHSIVAEGTQLEKAKSYMSAARKYHEALSISLIPSKPHDNVVQRNKNVLAQLFKKTTKDVEIALKQKKRLSELLVIIDAVVDSMSYEAEFTLKVLRFQRDFVSDWAVSIRKGKRSVQTVQDVYVAYKPSFDKLYLISPPLDGPTNKDQYFAWPCKIAQKSGSGYACWDTSWIMEGGELEAFLVKDINGKFTELLAGETVIVVGRYIQNAEVTLLFGNQRAIPVLKESYIFPRVSGGYSIKQLDEILNAKE